MASAASEADGGGLAAEVNFLQRKAEVVWLLERTARLGRSLGSIPEVRRAQQRQAGGWRVVGEL